MELNEKTIDGLSSQAYHKMDLPIETLRFLKVLFPIELFDVNIVDATMQDQCKCCQFAC